MSVIAIRKTETGFLIAGDSQTTWGRHKYKKIDVSDKQINGYGKIFQVNGMALGCAGSVAHVGLLLLYSKSHSPKEMDRDSILDWFIEFREWANKKANINYQDISIHALIVKDGKAFSFYDFLDVQAITEFDAVGSGMWLAIGAMEAGCTAEEAVKIAIKYDLHCGGEITKIEI